MSDLISVFEDAASEEAYLRAYNETLNLWPATHESSFSFSFGDMSAIFVRDPDRNVLEFDGSIVPSVSAQISGPVVR